MYITGIQDVERGSLSLIKRLMTSFLLNRIEVKTSDAGENVLSGLEYKLHRHSSLSCRRGIGRRGYGCSRYLALEKRKKATTANTVKMKK